MGAFIDQVGKNNILQQEQLTLKQQKQLEKDRKEIYHNIYDKLRLEIKNDIYIEYLNANNIESVYNDYFLNYQDKIDILFEKVVNSDKKFKQIKFTNLQKEILIDKLAKDLINYNNYYYKIFSKRQKIIEEQTPAQEQLPAKKQGINFFDILNAIAGASMISNYKIIKNHKTNKKY